MDGVIYTVHLAQFISLAHQENLFMEYVAR